MRKISGSAILIAAFAVLPSLVSVATAQSQNYSEYNTVVPDFDESVFIFGGRYHKGYFGHSFTPNPIPENNYGIAVGYQRFFKTDPTGWNWGLETGVAGRFGEDPATAELWAGGVGRYNGWVLGDSIRVSPSLTLGLSVVTDTFGIAKEREEAQDKSAKLLFYVGPEISFSHVDNPEYEVFWRAQHRSGAWGTTGLAPVDGANAAMVGFRYKF
ncbi:hypothetical protein [Maritalea myrionectae]|uniref:hypothetical protein n=1 Tax=Maritalea myrionectae TaxID=454601 RepID=UPI000685CA47|nr:hypothetical protein [Maritalea myrionectae]